MSANSNLLPPQCTESISTAYTAPVLIKDGVLSRLYRVSRAGKYFVVKTAKDGSGMQWDLLRREYELSIALSHPHIVTVFTFEEETSVGPGIVMEYIDGCTLAEFLLQQPSCRLRQRIMEQLLDAVAYFHRKGIVHNDLKPDNILINRVDHTLKIIDFGLSDNDANYLYRNLGCTPQYASPELRNHQPADCRSDIYSLGLIMRDVLGPRYAPVFSKALALDPSCRYANADEFTKAFLRMKSLPRRSLSALLISVILVLVAVMIAGSADNSGELRRLHIQNDSLRVELESLRGRYDQVTGTLSEISARTQRRKSFADSVYNDIESKMADIYSKLDDKLKKTPYREFAFMEMNKAMANLPDVWRGFSGITSDQELISAFISHYTLLQNKYYDRYIVVIQDKPILDPGAMTAEEYDFYLGLIASGKSYIRFEKSKDK